MEIKIHSVRFETDRNWATVIPHRIISFRIGDRRLFFHHSIVVDRRGSHYGQSCEYICMIKNPNEYKRLRQQFVRRGSLDDSVIKALMVSRTKSLSRCGSLDFPLEASRWREHKGGRSYRLDY